MAISADFYTVQFSDGLLTVTMSPSVNISSWSLRYREFKNFGGGQPLVLASGQGSGLLEENLVEKWCGSGTGNGVSGITILDSGVGMLRVDFPKAEISGREPGAYAYTLDRVDSGQARRVAEGYRLIV